MRQRFLELTPAGEKALQRSLPLWREAHAKFVAALGKDYWLSMRSELERLARLVPGIETKRQAIFDCQCRFQFFLLTAPAIQPDLPAKIILVVTLSGSRRMSPSSWGDIFTGLLRGDRIIEPRQCPTRGFRESLNHVRIVENVHANRRI